MPYYIKYLVINCKYSVLITLENEYISLMLYTFNLKFFTANFHI